MYTPYLSFNSVKILVELLDMFGTEKKFTTFDYYKKTGIRIHGQHINNLESCGLIRKIAVRNKGKDYPRGGIYIIPSRALTTIEKYNFREAMA